jgi:hypothetical protein
MTTSEPGNDRLTIAAIGLLAMCVVTCDHEALGHGSACLLLHGHISLLTSSLFRCDVRSDWIDPAGPAGNLLMGTLALVALRFVPARPMSLRLFLLLVTAFSYFWEGGYLMRAMHRQDGDLYFFARFLLGDVTVLQRWVGAAVGLALFVLAARLTSRALLRLWPQASVARGVARTAWLAATAGAALAALAYTGHGWGDFTDSVMEIGLASFPLLLIPFGRGQAAETAPSVALKRSSTTIALAAVIYAVFVATLGRGIVT